MRDILFTLCFLYYSFYGFAYTFIAALGYLWIDIVYPQKIAYSFILEKPLSKIMALILLASYLLNDRGIPLKNKTISFLILLFAIWITMTTLWAEVPDAAWTKWDWAFKGLLFAAWIPFLFRSRLQIEAALYTIIFAVSNLFILGGIKTLLGGGGYGFFTSGNSGLFESSTLALVCVMIIPIILFLKDYGTMFPQHMVMRWAHWGMALSCALTALGTFARTGLVAFATLLGVRFFKSKQKMRYLLIVTAGILLAAMFVPQAWVDRMETIDDYQEESSALGRLAVWAWTLEYVMEHPLGGGFRAFIINEGEYFGLHIHSKAFHSIYFEILGCHGFPGLLLFFLIFLTSWRQLVAVCNHAKNQGNGYYANLADSLISLLIVFLSGAAFIGVGFQPVTYYFIGLSSALTNCWLSEPDEKLQLDRG